MYSGKVRVLLIYFEICASFPLPALEGPTENEVTPRIQRDRVRVTNAAFDPHILAPTATDIAGNTRERISAPFEQVRLIRRIQSPVWDYNGMDESVLARPIDDDFIGLRVLIQKREMLYRRNPFRIFGRVSRHLIDSIDMFDEFIVFVTRQVRLVSVRSARILSHFFASLKR